jgi:hypothetical protein
LFVPEYQCENYDHFQLQQLASSAQHYHSEYQQQQQQQQQDNHHHQNNQQELPDQAMPLFPRRTNPAAALSASEHRRAIAVMEPQQLGSTGNIRDRSVGI